MGGDPNSHNARKDQGGDGQRHGAHAAGAQESDDQEGAEKDQCRSEVVHQRQTAAHGSGIADEQCQVPLVHDPIHGRSTGINEADFTEFRGLDGQRPERQPVFRAVILLSEDQGNNQETDARRSRKVAEAFCPFQVPQGPAHK